MSNSSITPRPVVPPVRTRTDLESFWQRVDCHPAIFGDGYRFERKTQYLRTFWHGYMGIGRSNYPCCSMLTRAPERSQVSNGRTTTHVACGHAEMRCKPGNDPGFGFCRERAEIRMEKVLIVFRVQTNKACSDSRRGWIHMGKGVRCTKMCGPRSHLLGQH
jgi:hypothetical protein